MSDYSTHRGFRATLTLTGAECQPPSGGAQVLPFAEQVQSFSVETLAARLPCGAGPLLSRHAATSAVQLFCSGSARSASKTSATRLASSRAVVVQLHLCRDLNASRHRLCSLRGHPTSLSCCRRAIAARWTENPALPPLHSGTFPLLSTCRLTWRMQASPCLSRRS